MYTKRIPYESSGEVMQFENQTTLRSVDSKHFLVHVSRLILQTIDQQTSSSFRQIVKTHFANPGKMMRPYLAFKLGQILGTPTDSLAAWAATCELLHNASLIHDDIQDRDTYRRGQKTLWNQFGDAQAINAGDFLMMVAPQPTLLSLCAPEIKIQLLTLFSQASCKIVNGQSLEMELAHIPFSNLLYEKYMECVTLKTAALFSDLAVGVNRLSPDSPFSDHEINEVFSKIGILFQMHDDLIDLYGDKQRDSRGCDIKEGKFSFLVVTHVRNHPQHFAFVKSILQKPRELTTHDDIEVLEKLFNTQGTVESCLRKVQDLQNEIFGLEVMKKSAPLKHLVAEMIQAILSKHQGAKKC